MLWDVNVWVVLLIMARKWRLRDNWVKIVVVSIVILCLYIGFEWGKGWERYKYVRVVDGDTIVVQNLRNGEETRMRLIGIDAPEVKSCFFDESTAILKKNLEGRRITYKIYGHDGFGRILAIVYADNVDVSQILVSNGAVAAYDARDVHDKIKPEVGYFTYLLRIEQDAKAKKMGIWSDLCLK